MLTSEVQILSSFSVVFHLQIFCKNKTSWQEVDVHAQKWTKFLGTAHPSAKINEIKSYDQIWKLSSCKNFRKCSTFPSESESVIHAVIIHAFQLWKSAEWRTLEECELKSLDKNIIPLLKKIFCLKDGRWHKYGWCSKRIEACGAILGRRVWSMWVLLFEYLIFHDHGFLVKNIL